METRNTPSAHSAVLCEELLSLLPAYSLGTATPEESRLVEALLPFCPEALDILAEYRKLGDGMLGLYPTTETPPSSAALLRRVRATTPAYSTKNNSGVASVKSQLRPQVVESPTLPLAAASSVSVPRVHRSWSWLVLAASIVVVFSATNLYWASQIDTLRRDQQVFLQALVDNQIDAQQLVAAANHHRELLPTAPNISPEASFVWNSDEQIGALLVDGLPSLDPGETYQLWLVRDEKSLSLGTFEVDDNGVGFLVFHSPQPVETFSHIGVNIEPDGGTSEPTTPHLIVGNI